MVRNTLPTISTNDTPFTLDSIRIQGHNLQPLKTNNSISKRRNTHSMKKRITHRRGGNINSVLKLTRTARQGNNSSKLSSLFKRINSRINLDRTKNSNISTSTRKDRLTQRQLSRAISNGLKHKMASTKKLTMLNSRQTYNDSNTTITNLNRSLNNDLITVGSNSSIGIRSLYRLLNHMIRRK